MPEYKLPNDSELTKCFIKGETDTEIAQKYGCTRQWINAKRKKLGFGSIRPFTNQANELIRRVWDVQVLPNSEPGSHHQTGPSQALRVWLRRRLGDTSLSPKQQAAAAGFETRIRRDDVVLVYSPDSVKGFYYVPREPSDGRSVIRWPDLGPGVDRDPEAEKFLTLPEEPNA
ncbi:hypothetical protein OG401_14245 [Kitasatospora purpeofusca]|uniref:hypothetical protein n=1 Tax=Kitasatospora purpeofusca TaxID=67352 RepID=UPI0022538A84|nr:hypothetical protein [Kitasatospora purpeofusca]MCX4685462.1 hypothetical protein [Kitasatospora purpeofusca]